MFCIECGTQLPDNAKFCPQCGQRVVTTPIVELTDAEYQFKDEQSLDKHQTTVEEAIEISPAAEREAEIELEAEIAETEATASSEELDKGLKTFNDMIAKVIKLPYVNVKRNKYLSDQLSRNKFDQVVIEKAIDLTPLQAGITPAQINKMVNDSINYESAKTTGISAVAGMPGGAAMVGTIPGDISQYYIHVLRVAQKIAYMYGWEDFVDVDNELSEETRDVLILFLGVMGGVEVANEAVQKIAAASAEVVAKRISAKALTKTVYYPIVKKIASILGIQMTKEAFGNSVGKVIPVIGGIVSGGMTFATFRPMCAKLRDELELCAK